MSAPGDRPPLSAEDRAMHDALNATTSTLQYAAIPDAWQSDEARKAIDEALAAAMLSALTVARPGRLSAPLGACMAFSIGRVHGLTRAEAEQMARAAIDFAYID